MADPVSPARPPSAAHPPAATTALARSRRGRIAALLRRPPRGTIGLSLTALALTLMTWPLTGFEPQPGLDPSWATGLNMAFEQGLDFGPDALFTYGPLGFLRAPVYSFPWTTRLSFAYTFAIQFALCAALLWALRRNFGSLLAAAAITLVLASLMTQEPVPVLVFAVLVGLVRGDLPRRMVPAILAATGVLVAVQLLAKINTGVLVAALAAIALLALAERRRAAVAWFAGGLTFGLVAGWAAARQSLSGIPDYVSGSLQIISGYSESMVYEDPGRAWELWAALVLAVIGGAIILRADAPSSWRAKLGMAAMWLVLTFTAFKSGFVRHEVGHANIFFATMLGGLAVLPLMRVARPTAALVLLFATMALMASARAGPKDFVMPLQRADTFLDQGRLLADGSRTNAAIVASRRRLAQAYALDPKSYAALKGHAVTVEPNELNVLWANRLEWKPVPVFQSYSAYTADLDERNAAAYASRDGPERVLRHNATAIDARNAAWESPAAIRAMLCNFRAVVSAGPWQVLERTADRCGAPRMLAETRRRFGESIAVPPSPGRRSAVYAEIDGVDVHGLERIVAAAYRATERFITLNGDRTFRLIADTAQNGLIMRVPTAVDFPAPFHLDQGAERLVVNRGRGEQPDDEIRVRFYAVDVR